MSDFSFESIGLREPSRLESLSIAVLDLLKSKKYRDGLNGYIERERKLRTSMDGRPGQLIVKDRIRPYSAEIRVTFNPELTDALPTGQHLEFEWNTYPGQDDYFFSLSQGVLRKEDGKSMLTEVRKPVYTEFSDDQYGQIWSLIGIRALK